MTSQLAMHRILALGIFGGLSMFAYPAAAHAAALTDLMYRLSTPVVESFSNHTIMFRSVSGMTSGSIILNLTNVSMNLTALTRDDLDLMYGSTQASIAATPGVGVWGSEINTSARTITFTYPTAGGTPISAGTMVSIRIGSHASYQAQGSGRLVNQNVSGAKTVSITAGSDSGTASVSLQTTVPTNTQMTNGDVGHSKQVIVGAGQDNGALAVSLIFDGTVGTTANRLQTTSMSGGIFAPSGLRGAPAKEGVVEIVWVDNSSIERGFIVERREVKEGRDQPYEAIAILDRNATSYRDTNLPPQRTFQYRVRSYNDITFSTYTTSGEVTTVPLAVPSAPFAGFIPSLQRSVRTITVPQEQKQQEQHTSSTPVAIEPPSNVLNLNGVGEDGRAVLTWGNPADPNLLYAQIQWSDSGFPQDMNEGVTVYKELGTSFTDTNLANDAPAYYTVFAVNKYGKNSSGAAIVVTPKGPPPPPQAPLVQAPEQTGATQPAPLVVSQESVFGAPPARVEEAPPQDVTLTLAAEVSKTILPQQEATLEAVNSVSTGEKTALALTIPSDTLVTPYEASVAPVTYDQVRDLDSGIHIPDDTAVLGDTYYKVSIERDETETHRFSKELTLRFEYSQQLIAGIVESTLTVHSWDPLMNDWVALPSRVDTEKKTVEAKTKHASLFTVFGKPKDKKSNFILKVISKTKISKQKSPPLRATSVFDLSSFITVNGRELVAGAGTEMKLCVSAALFARPVRFMSMTFDTSRYFLMYDFARKCYAGTVLMPTAIGEYPLKVKVVYADDRTQEDNFTLRTIAQKERAIRQVVQIVPAEQIDRFPWKIFGYGIIAFLVLLINGTIVVRLIRSIYR